LPFDDPHWQVGQANGARRPIGAEDVLSASSWEPYWPSAELERSLFLDGWLKEREKEGRKQIDPPKWEYCQDGNFAKLKAILARVGAWREAMGRLSQTRRLLSDAGKPSRLRVIFSTGVPTPTGIITEGAHDASRFRYLYEPANSGDGTMEARRVIDDLGPDSPLLVHLNGVPHGRLMIDAQFLSYFTRELSGQPMAAVIRASAPARTP